MSNVLLRNCNLVLKGQTSNVVALRLMSTVPAERKADFFPRVISAGTFPDVETLKLRRGTGGRSSFNGQIVTVFGATGFLARSLINGLAKSGCQVICPYRGDSYATKELKLAGDLGQILFSPFSLRDTDSIYRAMKHSNVVINLIGKENETINFDFESVNVEAARTIARIARELGVKRLIHLSALNSSPNPQPYFIKGGSKFLRTKYQGELAVREEFPEATIFRPADIYGELDHYLWPYVQFQRRSIRRISLANGGYDITKMPIAVSDVAQGIVNSITDEDSIGKTYDAVGPRRYELRQLIEFLNEVIGKVHDEGFRITNLRWDIPMRMRISMFTKFNMVFKYPKVHWEKIEREHTSDEKPQNPTLQDLGVRLQFVEDLWPWYLSPWRYDFSYDGDLGEKKIFSNPPYIVE